MISRQNMVAVMWWSLLWLPLAILPGGIGLQAQTLSGTEVLAGDGDIASELVDGVDRFLLRKLDESVEARASFWQRDVSSLKAYEASVAPQRERLSHILGVRDERVSFEAPEIVSTLGVSPILGRGSGFVIYAVRWPVIGDLVAEGLLLEPLPPSEQESAPRSIPGVIAVPDADQTPEQLVGLADGVPIESQFARRFAENGCRVLVPALVSREMVRRTSPGRSGGALLTHREFLYRSAFEMGRHLVGYEIQMILAGLDWLSRSIAKEASLGVFGYGEGGMLALYAGALDSRIGVTGVSGYFGPRESLWQEPISRNVFGLLEQFGDAELATMIVPRQLVIEAARGPEVNLPSEGGAPATLVSHDYSDVVAEVDRARMLIPQNWAASRITLAGGSEPTLGSEAALEKFLAHLGMTGGLAREEKPVVSDREDFGEQARLHRLIHGMDRHTQQLLVESPYVRQSFMASVKVDSLPAFEESTQSYRDYFYREVIGKFDDPRLPFNPRTRRVYDEEKWVGYEVVLDVFPDVMAYGILCVPKGIVEDERRPVVVCQHGLEGRPQDIVAGDHRAYHDFAARLAERGFVTFAPQNLYLFRDRFRSLQRKANPLKKTLFSIIIPQHQQIVDWLQTLPFVDPERIGFYGLSYGGKTAMRVPAVVTDYCLSICSADFNDWVWKNASTRSPYSYVWTGEYEIFEFDLGSTFNYSEMAALIAPRPFMVERGHFDGVAPDETVAAEFAKVRHLYAARLGLSDRCEIEWFPGPHTINGKGTYSFLHKHLRWPEP